MRILLAVIEDLYIFATSVLFGWVRRTPRPQTLALPEGARRGDVASAALIPGAPAPESAPERTAGTPAAVGAPVTERTLPQQHTIVYCAADGAALRAQTDSDTDSVIATLPYGAMLMVLEADPAWSYVAAGEKQGYIETRQLAHKAAGVYPEFVLGAENGPREPATVRLRSVIRDEFSGGLAEQSLGAHEYVYYKLVRRGLRIAWPDIRPRTPGSWAAILGALGAVTVASEPAAGAVLECTFPDGRAHLAYVEEVHEDGAVRISEADWPDRGIYNERVLPARAWRELNPAFIIFS